MTRAATRIAVLSTGGTITSMPNGDGTGGVAPSLGAGDLIGELAGQVGDLEVEAHTIRAVASSDLGWADVTTLSAEITARLDSGVDGVVVVQGTDTIEETSFALDLLHDRPNPVVVTGAMRHPTSAGADGPGNIVAALAAAACPAVRGCGVTVAFGDELHAARWVRKVHTSNPAAFASPSAGPLGWVAEGVVRVSSRPRPLPSLPRLPGPVPAVALVPTPLGDDGRLLGYLAGAGYAGVIVEGLGGGHVPSPAVETLTEVARQIPVVLASRCLAGEGLRDTYGFPGSERDLLTRGLISAGVLSAPKARVLLSLLLALRRDSAATLVEFCAVRDHLTW